MLSDGQCDSCNCDCTSTTEKGCTYKSNIESREGLQMYFRNKWNNHEMYEAGDVVCFKKVLYIAIKRSIGMTPSHQSVFWEIFVASEVPLIKPQFVKNPEKKSSFVEAYNQSSENIDKNDMIRHQQQKNKNQQIFDIINSDVTDLSHDENQLLYVSKPTNSKFTLSPSKTKWKNQIKFDDVIECIGKSVSMQSNNVVFDTPGFYKVTIKIIFSGVNQFKLAAYLLNPSDNFQSETFNSNKKIHASVYSQMCAASVKNCVHYTFPVNVKNALSTLVIATGHTYVKLTSFVHSENELIIYGKGKTWMLIEKL
jgi:hypothetical protein